MAVTPQSGNSHPRSQHMEPDVQVTRRALYLLHNAPAQQGRERMAGSQKGLHFHGIHFYTSNYKVNMTGEQDWWKQIQLWHQFRGTLNMLMCVSHGIYYANDNYSCLGDTEGSCCNRLHSVDIPHISRTSNSSRPRIIAAGSSHAKK